MKALSVTNGIDIMENLFLNFLLDFKERLTETYHRDMSYERQWREVVGTCGWHTCLEAASKEYMSEIYTLWQRVDQWSSDKLSEWIIWCAVWYWVIEPGSELECKFSYEVDCVKNPHVDDKKS